MRTDDEKKYMTNFPDIMSELDWAEETEMRQQEPAPQVTIRIRNSTSYES